MDPVCPVCEVPLLETRSSRAVVWTCPSCNGRAVGFSLLRRITEGRWAIGLWQRALAQREPSDRMCPSCRTVMVRVDAGEFRLDLCRGCQIVWFDAGEYERAPRLPERGARTLPDEALEAIAQQQARLIAADYKRRFGRTMSLADALPLVPGVMGLPVEAEPHALSRYPWTTWALTVVLALLGIWSLAAPTSAQRFALIATDIDRLGGAAFLSAVFVHATVFQLVTNLYFLLLFGDNVEDFLGAVTFSLLFLTGGLIGNALHAILAAETTAPLMGASGAVSAIVVFYACRFPNVPLRFFRLARWYTMPAVAGLLFWLLSKITATTNVLGRSEPSAWPYIGGAITGLVMFLILRKDTAR